ncbi:unnamed protein product [Microthlaspi erraticum]|uniref:Uncharacterized protein n=1 Tax=Microthlaspi erraticum TaxID=1685480 RepID=A0A6D2L4N5_9BRAS|nr:unnamed protein product [Microthlaspi erraticum]
MVIEKKSANVAEKSETELEDTVRRIVSWLVLSAFNILAYVSSRDGFMETPSVCKNFDEESWSWWLPQQDSLTYYDKLISILICRHLFWVQFCFAAFMIIVVKYLIVSALPDTKQTKRVTFNVLVLGTVCGFHGKLWVEILGGNGRLWLFVWATFCVFQFVPLAFRGLTIDVIEKKSANVAEKSEAELEDTVTRIVTWLVLSAFHILAYVFSRNGFMEAPSMCKNFYEASWSWWLPRQDSLAYYDKLITIFMCRHLFWVQFCFAVFMIFAVKYLIVSCFTRYKADRASDL